MKRYWIKLYIELLDDLKMGRLPDHIWRRAVELFLLAGEVDADGLLPPIEDMAWRLRTDPEEVLQTLRTLRGIVDETPSGWLVRNFKSRQYSESYERVKRYRNAKGNAKSNEDVADKESSSTSSSYSNSLSSSVEGEGVGEGTKTVWIPETPRQAKEHPDIQAFERVCGCFPGERDYQKIVETMQYLRSKHGDKLEEFLNPFWTAWSTRQTKEGKPYSKKSYVWFYEWAMQGEIPRANGHEPHASKTRETRNRTAIEQVAERLNHVHR